MRDKNACIVFTWRFRWSRPVVNRVKSLYSYVSIFLTGFRMGVRVRVRCSVSQWDSE